MKKKVTSMLLALAVGATMLSACGNTEVAETKQSESSSAATAASASVETGAATAATAASADLKQESGEFSLYTYYVDSDKEIVDYTLTEMKKIFPNVTVTPENRTDADGTVLKTRAAVGELPDIFECPSDVLESFVTSGDVVSLDDSMKAMGFADYVSPSILENRASSDGKIYAISAVANEPALIYYNKQVFQDAGLTEPKNYDEFKKVVKTLSDKGIIPLALFGQEKWPGLQLFDMAVVASDPRGMSVIDTGDVQPDDPMITAAAQKVSDLVSLGLIGKGAFNTNSSQAFEQFYNGQAGMLINGSWFFGDAKDHGDNIGYFTYNPFADAGKEEDARYHFSGGQMSVGGYAVSATSSNVELAKQWMLYFNIERAKAKTILNGAVCGLQDPVQPKDARYESYQQFADSFSKAQSFSGYDWNLTNPVVKTSLESGVEMMLSGNYDAAAFGKNVKEQIAAGE